jgi:hypothetical protein
VRTELEQLVLDIGVAIKRIDTRRPQAANARTGALYQGHRSLSGDTGCQADRGRVGGTRSFTLQKSSPHRYPVLGD